MTPRASEDEGPGCHLHDLIILWSQVRALHGLPKMPAKTTSCRQWRHLELGDASGVARPVLPRTGLCRDRLPKTHTVEIGNDDGVELVRHDIQRAQRVMCLNCSHSGAREQVLQRATRRSRRRAQHAVLEIRHRAAGHHAAARLHAALPGRRSRRPSSLRFDRLRSGRPRAGRTCARMEGRGHIRRATRCAADGARSDGAARARTTSTRGTCAARWISPCSSAPTTIGRAGSKWDAPASASRCRPHGRGPKLPPSLRRPVQAMLA